jgi:hypothetical protein
MSVIRARRWGRALGPFLVAAACALGALGGAPAAAYAKPEVKIVDVQLPEGEDAKKTKMVRRLLASAARRAQFGDAKSVRITARVTELELVEQGDVLKVRCTMVGRLEGASRARSRIEFGGRPSERKELERKVIGMVADGLMTRLAQMARDRAAKEAEKEQEPPASERR